MNPQHVPVDSLSESAPAETRRTGPGRAQIATAAFCFAVAFGLMVMLVTVPDLEGVWAVPVAAAVYSDDIYVDRKLSLETASAVRGLQVWESGDFHHDGIADDGEGIFARLLGMARSGGR